MQPLEILASQLRDIAAGTIAFLPQFLIAAVVLAITWGINLVIQNLAGRVLSRFNLRASLKALFSLLASIAVWVAGAMVAAVILFPGLTPASVLAGLGIGSVAIGFAFKDIFENFLAGVIILFRKEMRIGDHIECDGLEGEVQEIALRETHIQRTDGELVIVPNAMLFKNPLRIKTHQDTRRVTVMCGVAYDEDVDHAREIIRDAVAECDSVKGGEESVQIFAQAFGASSIDFEVTWWTGSRPVDVRRSRDEVVARVKRALDDAGIEIPFPYRTLTFKEALPIKLQGREAGSGDLSPAEAT